MPTTTKERLLWLRALLAFLVLPFMGAGVIPQILLSLDDWRLSSGLWPIGSVVLAAGLLVLLWCVRDFLVIGRGTLAPWDPPRHLVVVGLYRYVRNPMYVGVLMILVGRTLCEGSAVLAAYTVLVASAFHVRVVRYEEPALRRQFGDEFTEYARRVRRWLPRRPQDEGSDRSV